MADCPTVGVVGAGRLGSAVISRCTVEELPTLLYDPRTPGAWAGCPAPDVVVDCSAPPVTDSVLRLCAQTLTPLVSCVSNLDPGRLAALAVLARQVPVVAATNLSIGSYLQARAVDHVAALLDGLRQAGLTDVLPEAGVFERHPVTKAHRPSATAQDLADRWRRGTGHDAADVASLRTGAPVSDHQIQLDWPAQTLTIRHEVRSLQAAAVGGVLVARWVIGRPPGWYTVPDIFDDLARTAAPPATRSPATDAGAHT